MDTKDSFRDLQFDGKPSGYRDFRRKVILAVAGQESKHATLAGPRLLQRLQGEAWRATEHIRVSDLRQQDGWLLVLKALDQHYKYLPETELHEAVEEFLFAMKRKPGEGATSFSSRFRTQLSRVQALIAQERELTRSKKRRRKTQGPQPADYPSSLEESSGSSGESKKEDKPPSKSATEDEQGGETQAEEGTEAAARDEAEVHSTHTGRSKQPSSVGSKRKSEHASQRSRGTLKADQEVANRRMLEMLGTLEQGHLRPKPIFPQAILGHLYMRKFGLNREQRAHIIRATNGSSRLDDVERIVRASDLEEFKADDRRRPDDRRPKPPPRKEAYAVEAPEDSSSSLVNPNDETDESISGDALAAEADPEAESDQELQEVYEVQKRAKKEYKKQYKTYKESRRRVREIKKSRSPYLPIVALQQSGDTAATGSNQAPVPKQSFGYDAKRAQSKNQPKKKTEFKPSSRKEEANLTSSVVMEHFSYMVTDEPSLQEDVWLTAVPEGYAILDTGCTTSVVGQETSEQLKQFLQHQGHPPPKPCSLPPVELKGFDGTKVQCSTGLRWTVKIGQLWGSISTYVVPGSAPFLLSRRVLEGMEAKLDLSAKTLTSEKHGMENMPLRQASNGHLLLPLVPPAADVFKEFMPRDDVAMTEPAADVPQSFDSVPEDHRPSQQPRSRTSQLSTSDRRKALQHIVKNTRNGVVDIEEYRKELSSIFGSSSSQIVHAFVAYRPRLERIPDDAGTQPYHQAIASLTHDGVFTVHPWSARNAGAERRAVERVNVSLFAFTRPDTSSEEAMPADASHCSHSCYCCRECDSEGEEIMLVPESDVSCSTEALYGDESNWDSYKPLNDKDKQVIEAGIKALRRTYAQFIGSRLMEGTEKIQEELQEWLGPQAIKLLSPVHVVEVFTGKAPLSKQLEQHGKSCIRIGLDYGHDLNLHSHRRKLMLLLTYCQPQDVWISFPCGCWGPWSRLNHSKSPELAADIDRLRQQARRHLCPKTNKPILKPTRIVTSCLQVAQKLQNYRCDHKHEHAHLEGNYKGKPLTSYAETYPRKFCRIVSTSIVQREHLPVESCDILAESVVDLEGEDPDPMHESAPSDEPELPEEAQRLQAMIRKLHVNTGHASVEQMLRLANRCQVAPAVKQAIKEFTCPICEEHKVPVSHRKSAVPHAETPNHIVGIDFVQVELKKDDGEGGVIEDKFNVLTCVHLATDFAQQIVVPTGKGLSQAFHEVWTRPFGAPKIVYSDPHASTLSADFQHYLSTHNIQLLHCATESHWQLGRVEVANRVLRGMAQRVWQSCSRPHAEIIEVCASVRNQQLRKHGFSPAQWFLGHDPAHAGMLNDVSEQLNFPVQSQVSTDPEFAARVRMREEAAQAFLREHAKDTWRIALATRNRPMRGPYQVGQLVYFFRKRARGLLSTRHGVWYGPGKVIGLESSSGSVIPRVVWVAYNGFVYKCSPEGLRPMTQDEQQFRDLARDLAQGRLDPDVEQAEQSLSQRAPQYQDLTGERPEESDEELEEDCREEPLIHEPPFDEDDGAPRKIRRRITKSPEFWAKRAQGMQPYGSLQEGTIPTIVGPRTTITASTGEPPNKRRAVLEEIPEEEPMPDEDAPDSVEYTPSIADEPPAELSDVAMPEVVPSSEGVPNPPESEDSSEPVVPALGPSEPSQPPLEPPVSGIDQPVPSDDELMVETKDGPVKAKESVLEVSLDVTRDDISNDPLFLWHVLDDCLVVATQKAKLRRVEVSYRKLSPGDQELFKKAMQKEWQSWIDNKVTSICKNRGIDPNKVIRARWVLTWKKSSDPDDRSRVPKARLVLIGWQDPNLGEIATDSPTLRKESKHLVLSICSAKKWKVFGADIKTAFLSGDKSQREIYFKPPAELREWMNLSPTDLFRLEKAAYGLAEAPRAWFLRLSREMREAGLTQSQLDPCLFVLRIKGELHGACGIHVDDLLGGGTKAMNDILDKLRAKLPFGDYRTYTIRYTGIEIRQDPRTYEIEIGQEAYVDALECVQTKPLGVASTPLPDKSILRTCAGQLAWVSNATRPDQAFLSSYLQGVQDKGLVSHVQLYNKSIREMKEHKVCLRFPSDVPVEDWRLICIADAGWATRDNGDSQGGYLLLLAESKMLKREPAKCWLVDWSSKKLKRAVRSSVAAETLSGQNGLDALELFQAIMAETLEGTGPREFREMIPSKESGLVIDSKGFYDAITRSCCSQAISISLAFYLCSSRVFHMEPATKKMTSTPGALNERELSLAAGLLARAVTHGQHSQLSNLIAQDMHHRSMTGPALAFMTKVSEEMGGTMADSSKRLREDGSEWGVVSPPESPRGSGVIYRDGFPQAYLPSVPKSYLANVQGVPVPMPGTTRVFVAENGEDNTVPLPEGIASVSEWACTELKLPKYKDDNMTYASFVEKSKEDPELVGYAKMLMGSYGYYAKNKKTSKYTHGVDFAYFLCRVKFNPVSEDFHRTLRK
eukprot:Skav227626  [mRNA]  locus=C9358797:125:8101:- [translate_table: standard]